MQTRDYSELAAADQELLTAARAARAGAYAPYSGFQVGAALRTVDGRIFSGCNIENSSYGLTCCAERTAIFSAVAAGVREFAALAVVAGKTDTAPASPCGACRQVLAEFRPSYRVLLGAPAERGPVLETSVEELLPLAFHMMETAE
jgi:cytidine deaminase